MSRKHAATTWIYLIAEVYWYHPTFARHPSGGVPTRVFRHRTAAEAHCLQLNQRFQAQKCPFDHPPREVADADSNTWISWPEDEDRLRVLIDYVQDLGLPPPCLDLPLLLAWKVWWCETRPAMTTAQWQAIWAFLDRLPRYRVSAIDCKD